MEQSSTNNANCRRHSEILGTEGYLPKAGQELFLRDQLATGLKASRGWFVGGSALPGQNLDSWRARSNRTLVPFRESSLRECVAHRDQ